MSMTLCSSISASKNLRTTSLNKSHMRRPFTEALIPLHHPGHWTFVHADFEIKTSVHYDSYMTASHIDRIERVRDQIVPHVVRSLKDHEKFLVLQGLYASQIGVDCGIYAIAICQEIMRGDPPATRTIKRPPLNKENMLNKTTSTADCTPLRNVLRLREFIIPRHRLIFFLFAFSIAYAHFGGTMECYL